MVELSNLGAMFSSVLIYLSTGASYPVLHRSYHRLQYKTNLSLHGLSNTAHISPPVYAPRLSHPREHLGISQWSSPIHM